MKVKSIKIQNFKSFAKENNRIDVDEINTIIGKNESGKSNLIEAIGKLCLTGINDNEYFNNCNKNTAETPVISLVLTPYQGENHIYKSKMDTTIILTDKYEINVSGGISEIIINDEEFQKNKQDLNELYMSIHLNDKNDMDRLNEIVNMINESSTKIFINYTYIKNIINKLEKVKEYSQFVQYLKKCIDYLINLYSLFPQFILLDNLELKSKYSRKDIEDEFQSKLMLEYLLKCIGMDTKQLLQYWKLTKDDDRYNFVEDINYKIEKIISQFNKFYKQETVQLKVNFNNDFLNFVVKTNNKFLNLSERSNGLKWYLNMYIQLLAKTQKYNIENYVILLDEPGVYLHINAQKELLRLFEDFTQKDNQIIYTTQLPTMIYQDKLYRTRIVIKDDYGNSNISNKYYSLPHKWENKMETITPILTAIGMNMNYSFADINNAKLNIITEGISDYNYVKAYFIQKNYESECNIIPSSGVTNINNIVSILLGWGIKFKVLIDQDNEGRKQYKILTKKLLVDIDDIRLTDGLNVESKDKKCTIEDNFSEEDKKYIGIDNEDYDSEKAVYSLEILKKIENNEYKFSQETLQNFDEIFKDWIL